MPYLFLLCVLVILIFLIIKFRYSILYPLKIFYNNRLYSALYQKNYKKILYLADKINTETGLERDRNYRTYSYKFKESLVKADRMGINIIWSVNGFRKAIKKSHSIKRFPQWYTDYINKRVREVWIKNTAIEERVIISYLPNIDKDNISELQIIKYLKYDNLCDNIMDIDRKIIYNRVKRDILSGFDGKTKIPKQVDLFRLIANQAKNERGLLDGLTQAEFKELKHKLQAKM